MSPMLRILSLLTAVALHMTAAPAPVAHAAHTEDSTAPYEVLGGKGSGAGKASFSTAPAAPASPPITLPQGFQTIWW